MKIVFEWTKSGYAVESVVVEEVNVYSDAAVAWYDVCGTFDNINNDFHLYICRSGASTASWSYTNDFLYGTATLTGTPENCIVSDTTPTNYPEDARWTQIYLLKGNQADVYAENTEKAELKFAMIADEFISPVEFNGIRRLFHHWIKTGGDLPK